MKKLTTPDLDRGDLLNRLEDALYRGRLGRRDFVRLAVAAGAGLTAAQAMAQEGGDAAITQLYNARNPQAEYDYIVIGSGSGGSVVAGRLAAETDARVLVLEAGGTDQVEAVLNPGMWPANIRSERDWNYSAAPSPAVNNRALILPMGKLVGGGSSINATVWSRGHKNDFDFWASQTGDAGWNYENVLKIYRRIEDWQGVADPARRGKGGRLWIEPAKNPNPIAAAMLDGAAAAGIPKFDDQNGKMMEGAGGAAIANLRIRDGRRRNLPSDYLYGALKRPNLTLLTGTEVQGLTLTGNRVTGVTLLRNGQLTTVKATRRVVLCAGAMNTPKLLMLSGIGDEAELKRHSIKVKHHLPGVGRNFQDHVLMAGCIWEYNTPLPPANNAAEATFFWKSDAALDTPDLQPFQIEVPYASEVTGPQFNPPAGAWSIAPGLVRPKSRGRVTLASANPADMALVDGGFLTHPDDVKALMRGIALCREIGNSASMKDYVKREVMPGPLEGEAMKDFMRNATGTYFHESCTCKMGRDRMSVVDGKLSVQGVQGLSIADASAMPCVHGQHDGVHGRHRRADGRYPDGEGLSWAESMPSRQGGQGNWMRWQVSNGRISAVRRHRACEVQNRATNGTARRGPAVHASDEGKQMAVIDHSSSAGAAGPQPLYHGTKADLRPGDLIEPGYSSNYGTKKKAAYVYLSATLGAATWGAELALGEGRERIYIVTPTGPMADDPNLTDKKFPGNPTKSYRSRHALRVTGEVVDWTGHSAEELKTMRDHVERMRQLGVEAIDD